MSSGMTSTIRLAIRTLPENFDYPYLAASPREFWRRWHISLSSWIRDYLFIPLGGSRQRPARVAVNLLLVMAACGLWHGASFYFVVWGLLHGGFLVIERAGVSMRWRSAETCAEPASINWPSVALSLR